MGKKRKKKPSKRGQKKGRPYTPQAKQTRIMARHIAGQSDREIAEKEGIHRGTVSRIRNSTENAMLLQEFRNKVLDIVPKALKALAYHVGKKNLQATIETLYGARVLIQRHEVEKVEEPVRSYDYTKAEFFAVHGRLPLQAELEEFEKSLPIEPLVKDDTPVQ